MSVGQPAMLEKLGSHGDTWRNIRCGYYPLFCNILSALIFSGFKQIIFVEIYIFFKILHGKNLEISKDH